MNITTQQRILAALRNTTASAPAIAADFGVPTKVVRDMADEYAITMSTRAEGGAAPRIIPQSVTPIEANKFDALTLDAAAIGCRALLRRQLLAPQHQITCPTKFAEACALAGLAA